MRRRRGTALHLLKEEELLDKCRVRANHWTGLPYEIQHLENRGWKKVDTYRKRWMRWT